MDEPVLQPIRKKRWTMRRIIRVAILALVVAALALRWWHGRQAHVMLQVEIDAIRASGDPLEWRELAPEPIPDSENAAELYKAAVKANALLSPPASGTPEQLSRIQRLADMLHKLLVQSSYRAEHAGEVGEILALSRESLAICRQARSLTEADWKLNYDAPAIEVVERRQGVYRSLARLLCLAALAAHEEGHDAAALEYLRDALAIGRAIGKTPALIDALVALATDALVVDIVERTATTLDLVDNAAAERARTLVAELLDESDLRSSYVIGLVGERARIYDACEKLRRGEFGDDNAKPGARWRLVTWPIQPAFKKEEARILGRMTAHVQAAREPDFLCTRKQLAKLPPIQSPQSWWERIGGFLSILMPDLDRVHALHCRHIAMRRMAATALAMRLYEVENGKRPEKLDELVGKYLPAVPIDPFCPDGKPIRYLPSAAKPLLYSVNDDGKDDGGEFETRETGGVDMDELDLVFFLNGDRPEGECKCEEPDTQPTSMPTSAPVNE